MGALLAAISGLSGGVADKYNQIQDEQRQEKYKQQAVVRKALQDRYETEEDPEARSVLLKSMIDHSGYDKKTAGEVHGVLAGLDQVHQSRSDAQRRQAQQLTGGEGPAEGSGKGPGLPPLPPAPPNLSPLQKRTAQMQAPKSDAQVRLEQEKQTGRSDIQAMKGNTAENVQGLRNEGAVNTAGAKESARLKREQEEIKMFQEQEGLGDRPLHYVNELTPTGIRRKVDRPISSGVVSGANIPLETEHSGEGAQQIDHSPQAFYKVWKYAHGETEFQRVAAPAAQQDRSREVREVNPNTGERETQILRSGPQAQRPSVVNPYIGANGQSFNVGTVHSRMVEGDQPTGQLPPPPPPPPNGAPYARTNSQGQLGVEPGQAGQPGSATPATPLPQRAAPTVDPNIAAIADVIQNDFTTGQAMLKNYPPRSPMRIAVQNEVNRRMAAGQGPTPVFLGITARNQVQQAKLMGPEIDMTAKEIDRIKDKLGPVMGRWNEFLVGKVGSGDADFQKLRSDLSLIKSKVSQIHFGSQSGVQAVERFDKIMNSDKMDAETLKAGLSSLSQILKLYGTLNITSGAAMAEGGANSNSRPTPGTPVPASGGSPQAIGGYQIGHSYGGMVYNGGDPNSAASWRKK